MINFKTSSYFSGSVKAAGVLFFAVGFPIIMANVYVGIILWFSCLVIFSTHYRLAIDPVKKEYHDYLWILGLKSGEKGTFHSIDYLFIVKSRVKQTFSIRVASTTVQKEVFDGYLRLSPDNKIHIATEDDKDTLLKKLNGISIQLNVRIVDYTTGATA
jgi:hypothetical protein